MSLNTGHRDAKELGMMWGVEGHLELCHKLNWAAESVLECKVLILQDVGARATPPRSVLAGPMAIPASSVLTHSDERRASFQSVLCRLRA